MLDKIKLEAKKIVDFVEQKLIKSNKKMFIVSVSSFLLIIFVIIVSKPNAVKSEKIDFFVYTKSVEDFGNEIEINKQGKIVGSQEIVVSAQAMGRIKDIFVQEGQEVGYEGNLIEINDTVANYKIMLDRAKNALNAARLQYGQSKIQIEQTIEGNKLSLELAEQTLNTTKFLSEQNTRLAENTLKTSNTPKNNILIQMESEIIKLDGFLKNVLHQIDGIFGVTDEYVSKTYYFKDDLSANKIEYKENGESQLLDLYKRLDSIKGLSTASDIENTKIKNNISEMNGTYYDIKRLLDTTHNALIFSRSSSRFSQAQIDGFMAMINGLQSQYQANFGMFAGLKQNVDGSLIKEGTGFRIAGEDSSKISYQNTLISSAKQTFDAGLGLKTAELNYESIIQNKENTLGLAATNITSAELAYQEALKQYQRLSVSSPITGTVGKILVDKGQDISVGTPILTVINNSDPIAEIGLNLNEISRVNQNSTVLVEYMGETISGEILSIASQAGVNGLYNVIIKLDKKIDMIGDMANIRIFNQIDKFTLPINLVYPLEKNNGYIYILKDNKPEVLNIKLGEVWGDRIEILDEIPSNIKIITNNIGNYNPNINNLIEKSK